MINELISASKYIIQCNPSLKPLYVGLFVFNVKGFCITIPRYPGVLFLNNRVLEIEYIKDKHRVGGKVDSIVNRLIQAKRYSDNLYYIHLTVDGVKMEFLPVNHKRYYGQNDIASKTMLKLVITKLRAANQSVKVSA